MIDKDNRVSRFLRVQYESSSTFATIIKYILIVSNVLIVADAIFLLISEKDEYQGQFIKGRHQVSKYLLLMLYLDLQSFMLIVYGVVGIIATRKQHELLLFVYATLMMIMSFFTLYDFDLALGEIFLGLLALVYALMSRKTRIGQQYSDNLAMFA